MIKTPVVRIDVDQPCETLKGADGYMLGEHEMDEAARRVNVHDALVAALEPFAHYEKIRRTMGGLNPKSGAIWGTASSVGEAEITVEHMAAAIEAIALAKAIA